jgi:DNA polymerase-3 subunit beta
MTKMEFKIKRDTFLWGIQKTVGIVEKKTTIPILNNVLIKAEKDKIIVSATDLEVGLVAEYEAEVARDGKITVSSRKLHEMIREMQGDIIHVSMNERNMITMTCEKAIYKIQGLEADEFPEVISDQGVQYFSVDAVKLSDLIRKTSFAVSNDPMRKNLTGVFFEANTEGDQKSLRMVATDGHRMAVADAMVNVQDFFGMDKGVIVPKKGLNEIRKNIDGLENSVSIGVYGGMCMIKADHLMLKVSLIDADYPDYKRVIPSEKGLEIVFEKDKVLHALRRMSVISSDNYQGVIVKLADDKMILNSTNPDVGEANDEIDVQYKGKEVEFAYNVNFLIDAIDVIDAKEIVFEIGGAKKPALVKSSTGSDYYCIIMPLKY